ncbi:MAG: diversity-generating retroelement protein Avd [Planctomycetota bacterium]|nr:diversity-generating retroelement protein Avd [Planctomycetota bacterium]
MAKITTEMKVIEKTYDLVVWSCQHIGKFPRSHRFTLGDRLEQRLYQVLEMLLRAKYDRERLVLLQQANLELELLRFQFRLAKDLKCLSIDSYGSASRSVNEVGKLVGGWIKQSAPATNRAGT